MLIIHDFANATYEPWPGAKTLPEGANWVDAFSPTSDEVEYLKHALGVETPTLARMSEIESSSRLYRMRDSLSVTIPLPNRDESGAVANHPLAMIITPTALLTVRYAALRPCEPQYVAATVADRSLKGPYGALIGLVDSIVDHLADELENVTATLATYSRTIFSDASSKQKCGLQGKLLRETIVAIGRKREYTSLIEETLLALTRMVPFLESEAGAQLSPEARARLDRIGRDVASLNSHESRLSEKLQFLLDASLGLIGVEQNDIFKVLTIASVIGIPPTFFASMYGMNFKNIPEYDWAWGYQYGLTLLALSGLLPLLWFKYRRWF